MKDDGKLYLGTFICPAATAGSELTEADRLAATDVLVRKGIVGVEFVKRPVLPKVAVRKTTKVDRTSRL